ncbi:arsenite efflux transporter metallochaperone ArsD [Desulfurivibrio alkaliphilus]|uniref:Arsenical resistance operon trans-acting repressor ArsD n=1 Tax=Desulfurivibrio alkaliphilus (strain DSM 19089 / UNIQEM U267 / AHT2) TaxID=589865 RepID=D6Z0Q8_DESAT|nr:arsenite efflux transporter metallochaperone ArsD [Desulfurivibrio alkaliphilus]ADH85287.1 Arsenical resistance operon trans-acting repressor ArsD [Desulfurivibrio alkaliphilus AHT 2]
MPKKMEIFDPAMCCSTGICGPSVDPALVRFAADLQWLRQKGVEVRRYNLSQEPAAFAENQLVRDKLATDSTSCLPLILVNGVLKSTAGYPTRQQLAEMAQVSYDPAHDAPPASPETAPTLASLPLAGDKSNGGEQCC